MVALANTQLGAGMNASHVQVYGWVEVGGNVSTRGWDGNDAVEHRRDYAES